MKYNRRVAHVAVLGLVFVVALSAFALGVGTVGAQEAGNSTTTAGVNAIEVTTQGTAGGTTVYVGHGGTFDQYNEDSALYAVDAETGNEEWEFTEPSGPVDSSPTVVADPANGDSVGSRVLQGTLGHHNVFAENGPTQPGGGGEPAPDCSAVTYAGSGTDADPYEVDNVDQLQCIEEQGLDASYEVVSDIDASETASWNDGKGFEPVGNFRFGIEFTGTFDGKEYNITDLIIERGSEGEVGLFDSVGDTGTVTNIGIVGADITGSDSDVGGLVGDNEGLVSESYVIGEIAGSEHVGGLIGHNGGGTVTQSYAKGEVNGSNIVGGLVGRNDPTSTITESHATGEVSGSDEVGGLVGWNYGDTIAKSYATGSVEGSFGVGGLAGGNYGQITESYATGTVEGYGTSSNVGGLVGQNGGEIGTTTTISKSYATGTVNGFWDVGGLVGSNFDEGTIAESYAVGGVSGSDDVGGLVGSGGSVTDSYWDVPASVQPDSDGGTGFGDISEVPPADEMTGTSAESNMIGFDFTNTWETVTSPDDYPILAWQSEGGGNSPPTASFTYSPNNPEEGEIVSFDASSSSDAGGSIDTYEWDLNNDGQTEVTGISASRVYSTSGNYTVELTVTDDDGATDTMTQTVSVVKSQDGTANPLLNPKGEAKNVQQTLILLSEWSDTGGQNGGEIDGQSVGVKKLLVYLAKWGEARSVN